MYLEAQAISTNSILGHIPWPSRGKWKETLTEDDPRSITMILNQTPKSVFSFM